MKLSIKDFCYWIVIIVLVILFIFFDYLKSLDSANTVNALLMAIQGVGTVALVGVTVYYSIQTYKLAQNQICPLLVGEVGILNEGNSSARQIPRVLVTNYGAGPALRVQINAKWKGYARVTDEPSEIDIGGEFNGTINPGQEILFVLASPNPLVGNGLDTQIPYQWIGNDTLIDYWRFDKQPIKCKMSYLTIEGKKIYEKEIN